MEMISAVVLVSLVALLLFWGWSVVNWIWVRPKKLEKLLRSQGFAGNSYRIFYGDLKDRSAMSEQANSKAMNFSHDIAPRIIPSEYQIIHKYGKNSFTWFGPYPRVHIMDPAKLKDIFSLIDDVPKPNLNPMIKLLLEGIVSYQGAKWAKHKKIIGPAFHFLKLKDMVPTFFETCNEMVSQWERLVSKDGSCELDVMPYLHNLTADIISRTACGSSYEEGQMIFQRLKELTALVITSAAGFYIPGWRFLPTKSNNEMKRLDREISSLLLGIIRKRQKAIEKGELVAQTDLLGLLLESNLNEIREHDNNKDVGMSLEDVVKECKVFYLAGQETTASLLVWTMVCLSVHKEWQERARAEILQVFGNREPDYDGLTHLRVVTMILNEVLRLYPPAGMLNRIFEKETKLGELTMPGGVLLGIPVILIHRDREIWGEDADEFNPERFSQGVSNAAKVQPAFFPFGWGPRICMGQNFSMMEAKMLLSLVLPSFSFELSPSYAHAPMPIMTTQPQHGAHIIFHKL